MSEPRADCGMPAVAALAGVPAGLRILDRRLVTALENAATDASAAEERIHAAETLCRSRLETLMHRARHEGVTAGHTEATAKLFAFITEVTRRADDYEAELIRLVVASVEKILDKLPPEQMVGRLAARALADTRRMFGRVTLSVHPSIAAEADALRVCFREAQLDVQDLSIEEDPALSPRGCRLSSTAGEIDASVDVQLAALAAALLERGGNDAADTP